MSAHRESELIERLNTQAALLGVETVFFDPMPPPALYTGFAEMLLAVVERLERATAQLDSRITALERNAATRRKE